MHIVRPLRDKRDQIANAARDLHLWLLEALAWVMARVRAPRILRLQFQRDIRKARRDIRFMIFLGMVSRLSFPATRAKHVSRPNSARGWRRRRTRLIHAVTRGISLRSVRDMRDALRDFDRTVEGAIARLPQRGGVMGAVVGVIAAVIGLRTFSVTPAAEAADTS